MSTPVVVETRPMPELRRPGGLLDRAPERAVAGAERIAWLPPLLARIALGGTFATTGWGKLHDLTKVTGYFTELGLPAPAFLARVVGMTELACGLLVFVGFITRLAAIPLIAVIVIAIPTARLADIHGVADFLGLEELTYALLLFWIVIAGPGRVSLDQVVVRWMERTGTQTKESKS
jgi:putative oxidoreductase